MNHFFKHFSRAVEILRKSGKKEKVSSDLLVHHFCRFLEEEKKRSIYYNPKEDLNTKKVERVKHILLKRAHQFTENNKGKVSFMVSSLIVNLCPLIVRTLEHYLTPHLISTILQRALHVLLDQAKRESESKKRGNASEESPSVDRPLHFLEAEIAKKYGELIRSIAKNLLRTLDLGFFLKTAVKMISGLAPSSLYDLIGVAVCKALNPSVQSDLKKINFAFTLLFEPLIPPQQHNPHSNVHSKKEMSDDGRLEADELKDIILGMKTTFKAITNTSKRFFFQFLIFRVLKKRQIKTSQRRRREKIWRIFTRECLK